MTPLGSTARLRTLARTGACALALCGAARAQSVEGILEGETVWTGEVTVTGDLTVPVDAMLTVREGTHVRIAASDGRHEGWDPERIEIHVRGVLRVLGSEERPIEFAPVNGTPFDLSGPQRTKAPWHGIVLHYAEGEGGPDEIQNARIAGAFAAVQVPDGGPRIVDSVFLGCRVGVEVGSAYRDERNQGAEQGTAQPEILRCRFAGCYTGVYVEGRGSPDVERSVFYGCTVGIGNDRPGYAFPLHEPGAVIDHCALLRNATAVIAPAVVHDSILAWNDTAAALSAFHSPFAASIDHTALHTVLLFENKEISKGEVGLATDPVSGDPLFEGRIDALGQPGPPLPGCLALQGSSPARGRAADGSDLGPMGAPGAEGPLARWRPAGTPVRSVLALPYESKDKRKKITEAAVAQAEGKRWWVAPPVDETGVMDLRAVFGETRDGWLAFPVRAAADGEATIEVNGDVDAAAVQCDGKDVAESAVRRRFGESGTAFAFALEAGDHLLAVHVRGWTTEPRLGLSLQAVEALALPPGEAEKLEFKSARLKKGKRFNSVELTSEQVLNWSDSGRTGLVRVYGKVGEARTGSEMLGVEILAHSRLRVIGVPVDWKKPMSLVIEGLHRPDGTEYPETRRMEVR